MAEPVANGFGGEPRARAEAASDRAFADAVQRAPDPALVGRRLAHVGRRAGTMPAAASSSAVTSIGRPTMFVRLPVMRTTNGSVPSSWMPYPPALPCQCRWRRRRRSARAVSGRIVDRRQHPRRAAEPAGRAQDADAGDDHVRRPGQQAEHGDRRRPRRRACRSGGRPRRRPCRRPGSRRRRKRSANASALRRWPALLGQVGRQDVAGGWSSSSTSAGWTSKAYPASRAAAPAAAGCRWRGSGGTAIGRRQRRSLAERDGDRQVADDRVAAVPDGDLE